MDAPEAGGLRPPRRTAFGRVAARVGGVSAILATGVVAGLPVAGADAAPVEAAERTVVSAPGAADGINAREHAAAVERAEAAAAERAALQAGAKPQRAAWAERLEVIAHRGGTEWGPESTLAAVRHAIGVGTDALELDVRFTRDGVPVILHDETLDRTTNCRGAVASVTLRQLKRCDAGSWYRRNPQPGERVPTLDEALEVIRRSSAEVYIHVKVADGAQARRLVSTVRDNEMDKGRTTYLSDWHPVLASLRAAGAQRLGFAFHDPSGWDARYDVLIPQDVDVRRADVARAQKRGAYVVAVEGTPVRPGELDDLGLDGFMANDVEAVLDRVDRTESKPQRDSEDDNKNDKKDDSRDDGSDDGRDGDDGRPSGGDDEWDPNGDWDDDDWDPTGPDGPWSRER